MEPYKIQGLHCPCYSSYPFSFFSSEHNTQVFLWRLIHHQVLVHLDLVVLTIISRNGPMSYTWIHSTPMTVVINSGMSMKPNLGQDFCFERMSKRNIHCFSRLGGADPLPIIFFMGSNSLYGNGANIEREVQKEGETGS